MSIAIVPPTTEADLRWLAHLWRSEWGGDGMVSRGHMYPLSALHALLAKVDGEFAGAATYRWDGAGGCELMSLNAIREGAGIGTKLLEAVERTAREAGCRRVWLITSNDNVDAMRFYQRRGYRISAVYPGAVDEARAVKPSIPLVGNHGIEIHDEIELAKSLAGEMR